MNPILFLDVLSRWIHVAAACLAIGGAFFLRVVLPIGISHLDPEAKKTVLLRTRRPFKIVVHAAVTFLLLSGAYNAVRAWGWYTQNPPLLHGMFGMHLLLGLAVITLSLVLLAGAGPRPGWMKVNLGLMALVILSASALKWAREHTRPPATFQYMQGKAAVTLERPSDVR